MRKEKKQENRFVASAYQGRIFDEVRNGDEVRDNVDNERESAITPEQMVDKFHRIEARLRECK